MVKKLIISKEVQVLIKLLRIALGTEPRKYFGEVVEPFPEGIDWNEVVRLSYEHKVSALVVDGLESSKYDPYRGLDEKQTEELKSILVPWIKDVENTEWSYCYYVEVLKTLNQVLINNELTPIILKGYGLSRDYPRPSHRGAGDIDLFIVDKYGCQATDQGNEIMKSVLGVEFVDVDKVAEHHYEAIFKGITIENHKELLGANRNGQKESNIKKELKSLITEGIVHKEGMYFPSCTFNYVYLMLHMYSHAYCGILTIRQLCDYLVFLRNHHNKIDWDKTNNILASCGFRDFENGINTIIVKLFGVSESLFKSNFVLDEPLADEMLLDVMTYTKKDKALFIKFNYVNRWHLKFYSHKNWIKKTVLEIAVFVTGKERLSWMKKCRILNPIKRFIIN